MRRTACRANAKTVAQLLGSWSAHVESWVGERAFPVIVLRYEDMLADPAAAFAPVVEAMGAPVDAAVMAAAVSHASFESLAAQEAASGFEERGASQERFFRAGRAGVWQDALPEAAAARIRADHGEVMARYGY